MTEGGRRYGRILYDPWLPNTLIRWFRLYPDGDEHTVNDSPFHFREANYRHSSLFLDFRYVAPFGNHSASNATVVENRDIVHIFDSVKIRGVVGEIRSVRIYWKVTSADYPHPQSSHPVSYTHLTLPTIYSV